MAHPDEPLDPELVATLVQNRGDELHAVAGLFVFTAIEGPDKGLVFQLDGSSSRVLLGQSPACDVRLGDHEVSRRHVSLDLVDGGVRLRDLGSTNGTWVDRVKVTDVELRGDERVRIGATVLRVDRTSTQVTPPPPPRSEGFGRMVGASLPMRRLYPLCQRLAASTVPTILEGETGTGKEVLAESLHEMGSRSAGPFVVFDCTAVPASLVESELFGHERGAFTGAVASRKGVFEQARGGTLLIDEIGDLDLSLQSKLLRAIERNEIRRVGGDHWVHVDARVLAATRRDLDREVLAGRFRDDLFHRLAVGRIELPPLRERHGDVTLLVQRFWRELGGDSCPLKPEVLARWEDYGWPGNVRELRNAVARRLALGELAEADAVGSTRLAADPSSAGNSNDPVERALLLPYIQARDSLMEEFEHRYVKRVLALHGNDTGIAAAASGIGLRYFQRLKARSTR